LRLKFESPKFVSSDDLEKKLDDMMTHQLKATLVDFAILNRTGRDLESHTPENSNSYLILGGFTITDGIRSSPFLFP